MQGRLIRRTSKIIAVSASLKENLVNTEGIDPEKVVVIHNGIDLDQWCQRQPRRRAQFGVGDGEILIAAVGRLVDWKGHAVLIKAMRELVAEKRRVKVVIAGDGPRRSVLEGLVTTHGLGEHVCLLGYIDDVRPLLAAADIFVLPSLNEPFGTVLLEAMAAGLPIVATNGGGVPEIITERVGLLVPSNDAQALAKGLKCLIDDSVYRERLGQAALADVKARFSLRQTIEKTEQVYGEFRGATRLS